MRKLTKKLPLLLTFMIIVFAFPISGQCVTDCSTLQCGCKPTTCAQCLWLCSNCDGPPSYVCDEPTADASAEHPCHYYCK